jgi:hypothetical protein
MAKLYHNTKKCKVGVSDLKDYPTNGIHHHHMALANYCKGMGIDQNEAIRLIYLKYQEKAQRRELQKKRNRERGSQGIQ